MRLEGLVILSEAHREHSGSFMRSEVPAMLLVGPVTRLEGHVTRLGPSVPFPGPHGSIRVPPDR